jgi:type IV pilus assembly protein PilZ
VAAEKRKHPRQNVQIPVAFQREGGPRLEGLSRDMSIGGMFVETSSPAPFGATVQVFMTLPGLKQEVSVKATVRWTEPDGMGVQFGLMGARETHALTRLIAGPPSGPTSGGPTSGGPTSGGPTSGGPTSGGR